MGHGLCFSLSLRFDRRARARKAGSSAGAGTLRSASHAQLCIHMAVGQNTSGEHQNRWQHGCSSTPKWSHRFCPMAMFVSWIHGQRVLQLPKLPARSGPSTKLSGSSQDLTSKSEYISSTCAQQIGMSKAQLLQIPISWNKIGCGFVFLLFVFRFSSGPVKCRILQHFLANLTHFTLARQPPQHRVQHPPHVRPTSLESPTNRG